MSVSRNVTVPLGGAPGNPTGNAQAGGIAGPPTAANRACRSRNAANSVTADSLANISVTAVSTPVNVDKRVAATAGTNIYRWIYSPAPARTTALADSRILHLISASAERTL
jgi:hypothetical protein